MEPLNAPDSVRSAGKQVTKQKTKKCFKNKKWMLFLIRLAIGSLGRILGSEWIAMPTLFMLFEQANLLHDCLKYYFHARCSIFSQRHEQTFDAG